MSYFLDLKDDFSNFDALITHYDDQLANVEQDLDPSNKSLHDANKAHPVSYQQYAGLRSELKALERYVDMLYTRQKGLARKRLMETSNIAYGARDLDVIVAADDRVIATQKFLIITQELLGQYDVVVKAFEHLGYKLKNITDARIAEVHQFVI